MQNIVDIITGSIHEFIDYSVVAYALLKPDNIIYKAHLEESVSKEFVDDVKKTMLESMSALIEKDVSGIPIEELITGSIMDENNKGTMKSFFNIPVVIRSRVVGVITVAHTKEGQFSDEETTLLYKATKSASNAISRLETVIEIEKTKMATMVESMKDGVLMLDNDYRVLIANPAVLQIIGVKDGHDIDIFDVIESLGSFYDVREKINSSISNNAPEVSSGIEINEKVFDISTSPVWSGKSGKSEVLGTVTIFHDITEEKRLERLKEEFTAMMVHELRSPLTGIKQTAELMQEGTVKPDSAEFSEYSEMLFDSSSQMLSLVNDMLDVSKIDAGKFEIHPELVDLRTLSKKSLAIFELSAQKKKVALETTIDPRLPASVYVDFKYMGQVINNFISNAIKFTESGAITLQILFHKKGQDILKEASSAGIKWFIEDKTKFNSLDDSVVIAVTDSGFGIPKEDIGKLFNKFTQTENALRSTKKGTGLGLAVVKGVAEAHKGTYGAASKVGIGSTFYLTFPITSQKSSEENKNPVE